MSKPLGDRIRQARERAGMSQDELQRRIGVSSGQVSEWELGKQQPRALRLKALAQILEVSADWLLGLRD